jgi:predicted ester cyclase
MSETNKAVVRRLVDEVMNAGRLDVIDDIYTPRLAPTAHRWIAPFRESFPDMRMEIVDLIAEDDKVVGRFACAGTHHGTWRGHAPTGRRFHDIAEVYIFTIHGGRIASAWGLEDTHTRMRQLGIPATA